QSEQLIASATEELDRLSTTVGRAGCCLLRTDKNGIALERRGAAVDDKEFRERCLGTGAVWTEASIGNDGSGTARAD
ncbi:sigma-54-dependent Fis family transcriptional regulator, partial [Rhizobium ruizarguesonis]